MPKQFKNDDEKTEVLKNRLLKQKHYEKIKRYEKKKQEEINKPCAYIKFRDEFMKETTGIYKKYSNKNYIKHISYCSIYEMYDAGSVCEHCICGKDIRYVFVVEYKNPVNLKESMFCVGSECIEKSGNDGLRMQMQVMIEQNRKLDYTCIYCSTVCIHEKSKQAFDLYDIENKKCKACQSKPWCELCKTNLKKEFYHLKCLECGSA